MTIHQDLHLLHFHIFRESETQIFKCRLRRFFRKIHKDTASKNPAPRSKIALLNSPLLTATSDAPGGTGAPGRYAPRIPSSSSRLVTLRERWR